MIISTMPPEVPASPPIEAQTLNDAQVFIQMPEEAELVPGTELERTPETDPEGSGPETEKPVENPDLDSSCAYEPALADESKTSDGFENPSEVKNGNAVKSGLRETQNEADGQKTERKEEVDPPSDPALPSEQPQEPELPAAEEPVLQAIWNRDGIELKLREDVSRDHSIIKWNGEDVWNEHLKLRDNQKNLLTWELCNAQGRILDSSEQAFHRDPQGGCAMDYETEHFSVLQERMLELGAWTENRKNAEVRLDGKEQDLQKPLKLTKDSHTLEISSWNEWGFREQRTIEIRPTGQLRKAELKNGEVVLELEGSWEGLSLRIENRGEESTIPFESSILKARLKDGKEVRLYLVHNESPEKIEVHLEKDRSEEPDAQNTQIRPSIQSPQNNQAPSAPSSPGLSEKASVLPDAEKITFQADAGEALGQVSERMAGSASVSFLFKGKPAADSDTWVLSEAEGFGLEVRDGSLLEMKFKNALTGETCDSLEEARAKDPEGIVIAEAAARDLFGNREEKTFRLLPEVSEASTVAVSDAELKKEWYSMDAEGKLNQKTTAFWNRPAEICLGVREIGDESLPAGSDIRIYLNVPLSSASISVNGKQISADEETDEFGLPYIPVTLENTETDIEVHSDLALAPLKKTVVTEGNAESPSFLKAAARIFGPLLVPLSSGRRRRHGQLLSAH